MLSLPLKVYAAIGGVLALGLIIGFLRHHWIQEGLAQQRAADAAALESARVASERKEKEWEKKYADVKQAFEAEVAANASLPHIQPVRVCRPAGSGISLPPAPDAARGPAAVAGSLPTSDGLSQQSFDLGPSLELFARSADAVVAMCRRLDSDVRVP